MISEMQARGRALPRLFLLFFFTHAMTQVAPPPVLNFNLSGAEIRQLIKSIIAEERALNDEIAALKPEEQTFANVIPRIARFENANEGKIFVFFFKKGNLF